MEDKTFGKKVKAGREKKSLSQFDLATMVSVSQGQICKIENDLHIPKYPLAIDLCIVLEINITDEYEKRKVKFNLI